MNKEEKLRKQAIVLHLQGLPVQAISLQLNRSRQWVYKWVKRSVFGFTGERELAPGSFQCPKEYQKPYSQ